MYFDLGMAGDYMKTAMIVVGLQWGDEGKGSITDAICRKMGATLVVRFNGGPQAAHRVVTEDGRAHVFSSFGAGTLAGADTYLSEHVLVDPFALLKEAEALERLGVDEPLKHLFIHRDCLVITPFHRALNRAREASRGADRHGSCGIGFGEAVRMAQEHPKRGALRMLDALSSSAAYAILRYQWMSMQDEYMELGADVFMEWPWPDPSGSFDEDVLQLAKDYASFARSGVHVIDSEWIRFRRDRVVVCEGAQGVLLDEDYGFPPHTTWSSCTPANAYAALAPWAEADTKIVKIGVTRAYATRHGPGPFPTEDKALVLPDVKNGDGPWQGPFRVGHLDFMLLEYAMRACGGVDYLAVTNVDRLAGVVKAAYAYQEFASVSRLSVGHHRLPLLSRHPADREFLGRRLATMTPKYMHWTFPQDTQKFLAVFQYGWPLGIVSRGPTAADKLFADTGVEPWSSATTASATASSSGA